MIALSLYIMVWRPLPNTRTAMESIALAKQEILTVAVHVRCLSWLLLLGYYE
jgi:hypothetical protein